MLNMEIEKPPTRERMASYAALSPIYADLIEKATADPRCWLPEQFDRSSIPQFLNTITQLQRWPIVVTEQRHAQFGKMTSDLVGVLRRIVFDAFREDLAGAKAYFRAPVDCPFEHLFAQPNGLEECIARADFVLTDRGLQLLEFNMGPSIAGWEVSLFERFYRADPQLDWLFRDPQPPLSTLQPIELMIRHAFKTAHAHFCQSVDYRGRINLGIAVAPDVIDAAREMIGVLRGEARGAQASGNRTPANDILCFSKDSAINCTDSALLIDGARVHAIIDLTHETSLQARFIDAFKAGAVVLLNAPAPVMLGSKSSVALLSEAAALARTGSAADKAIVEAMVPWTRRVVPDSDLDFHGDAGPARDILLANRARLVLKPDNERSGIGVLIGARASEAVWSAAVDHALLKNCFVAQELCISQKFVAPANGRICTHDLIWSVFVFGNEFAGSYVRMLPDSNSDGVVNVDRGATETIVFQHA